MHLELGTNFRAIYSDSNGKWYRKSWKKIDQLKDIGQKYYCSNYYDVSVNKCGVKCGTSLKFWENNRWSISIDPFGWFQWHFRHCLDRRSSDDERQINRWKRIVSRFKGKLINMIKNGKFDDDSVSP